LADFLSFNEGRKELASNGLPTTCYFLLSTKDCATHVVGDTLVGGVGEITGTGYSRQSQAEPTPTTANPTAVSLHADELRHGSRYRLARFCEIGCPRHHLGQHRQGALRLEPSSGRNSESHEQRQHH
jgi:hypothetical protein